MRYAAVVLPPPGYGPGPLACLLRGEHVNARVRAPDVVQGHDSAYDLRCLPPGELHSVQPLGLEDPVDAFRDGVLVGVPLLRHADKHPSGAERAHILGAAVLASPVGVVDEPLERCPRNPGDRHCERPQRASGIQALVVRVPDDLVRVRVRHERRVQERPPSALSHLDVGDVAHPHLTQAAGDQASHGVRPFPVRVPRVRGHGAGAASAHQQAVLAQQGEQAVAADRLSRLSQQHLKLPATAFFGRSIPYSSFRMSSMIS